MVSVLGSFRLTLNGHLVPICSDSKSEHLLISLALAHHRRVPRVYLLERVWPEYDRKQAGQCLNSLTSYLNKLAKPGLKEASFITQDNSYYRFNRPAGVAVDVACFEAWRERGLHLLRAGDVTRGMLYCEQALSLYRGDLGGEPSIETLIERERLRIIFLDLLTRLADYHYAQNPVKALPYLQRLLAHDVCREDAHRLAMRCYMRLGQRAQALHHYEICCQALALEFEAGPEPATVALFNQIRLDPDRV